MKNPRFKDPIFYFQASQVRPDDFPCWANQSRTSVFFTRGLSRYLGVYAWNGAIIIFALMFSLKAPLSAALCWVGFYDTAPSHFTFLNEQYSDLIRIGTRQDISIADFHILEVCIWISIAIWGTRLVAGLAYLKQYDKLYSVITKDSLWMMLFVVPFGFVMIIVPATIQTGFEQRGTLVFKMLRDTPSIVLWTTMALGYCLGICCIVKATLFFTWKLFRDLWPWADLWNEDRDISGSSRNIV